MISQKWLSRFSPDSVLAPQEVATVKTLYALEQRAVIPLKWLMLFLALILLRLKYAWTDLDYRIIFTLSFYMLTTGWLTWLFLSRHVPLSWFRLFSYLSLAIDVITFSMLVSLTGGLQSVFYYFFFLLILRVAGLFQNPAESFMADFIITLVYLGSVLLADSNYPAQELMERVTVLWGVILLAWFLVKMMTAQQHQLAAINDMLARQSEQNSLLLSGMQDGVILTDTEGRIELANTQAEKFLRAADDQRAVARSDPSSSMGLAPEPPSVWMAPDDLQSLYRPQRAWWWHLNLEFVSPVLGAGLERVAQGEQLEHEILMLKFGVEEHTIILGIRPLGTDRQQQDGWLLLLRDVSAYRTLEQLLVQSEKLAAVGKLAAGLAHELGNPLGIINSCAGYLREKTTAQPDFIEELEVIRSEAMRCERIIRQLLDFASQDFIKKNNLDLVALVKDTVNLIKYQTPPEVEITKDLPQHPVIIQSDRDLITQALLNLLLNALQATDSGIVQVELSVDNSENQHSEIILAVHDQGRGIPAEQLHRIFEPFFTTREKGTGLGLAITYRIVERLGGTIHVNSKPGQGSVFTIRLPVLTQTTEVGV